jgi:hypothetical protein
METPTRASMIPCFKISFNTSLALAPSAIEFQFRSYAVKPDMTSLRKFRLCPEY